MSEGNYTFPPYEEKIREALKPFDAKQLDFYQGKDIRVFQELKGKNMESSKYLYAASKLEKISYAVHNFKDMLMSYGVLIWPDDAPCPSNLFLLLGRKCQGELLYHRFLSPGRLYC